MTDSRMTRRSLLGAGAAGTLVLAGGGVLATRGGDSGSAGSSTRSATGGAAPRKGGVATISAAGGPTDKLDPALMAGTMFELAAAPSLYNNLVRLDLDWKPSPDLATDWHVSKDARSWQFRLRDGVNFHDGHTLTSADVAYTLRRILDKKLASPAQSQLAGVLSAGGIRTPDPTTVELRLDRAYSFLPIMLASFYFGIVPTDATDPSKGGTGPFVVKRFQPGASLELERFPDYFSPGKPYLDGLNVVSASDDATRVQAVLQGTADFAPNVPPTAFARLTSSSRAELVTAPSGVWSPVVARTNAKPFDDPKVVQAMKLAVDRQKMVDVLYGGKADVGADVPIPTSDPFYPEGLAAPQHDPEQAKALLKQAGYADGLKLTLFTKVTAGMGDIATVYKAATEGSGLNADIKVWPAETYWDQVWLKRPLCLGNWTRMHVSVVLPANYASGGSANESAYRDPKVDKLIQQATGTIDQQRQKELYGEALRSVQSGSGAMVPLFAPKAAAKSKRLQGVGLDWYVWTHTDGLSLSA